MLQNEGICQHNRTFNIQNENTHEKKKEKKKLKQKYHDLKLEYFIFFCIDENFELFCGRCGI